jgi:hypothetical protein
MAMADIRWRLQAARSRSFGLEWEGSVKIVAAEAEV